MPAADRLRRALWSSYFPSWLGTSPRNTGGQGHDGFPFTLDEVLDVLVSEEGLPLRAKVPPAVLAAAHWNLLGRIDEIDPRMKPLFEAAVKDLLGLENLEHAKRAFSARTSGAVPALGTHALDKVLESSLVVTDDGLTCTATADLVVNRPFDEIDVVATDLRRAAARASLFWELAAELDDRPANGVRSCSVKIHLPNQAPAVVGLRVGIGRTHATARADLDLDPKVEVEGGPPFSAYSGLIEASKEPGRPGITRLHQERSIRFEPWHLHAFRVQILMYLLTGESLALALGGG